MSDPSHVDRIELFAAGEGGYHTYRIPSLCVTTEGTLIFVCEGRKHNRGDWTDVDLLMRRSRDNGRTWTAPEMIADDGELTMGNPCAVVDRSTGTIWLLLCRGSEPGRGNAYILAMKSNDDGQTWSPPTDISHMTKDPSWAFVGTGPGHGIQLRSGRLLVPCWTNPPEKCGEIQTSYCIYSDDHGVTWQMGDPLTANASDECKVVELADGTVYMNARGRSDVKQRAFAYSADGGHSWTRVRYDPSLPEPSCDGALAGVQGDDGVRILLAWPADPGERKRLTVRLSDDGGRTWPVGKILDPSDAAYCDLAVAPDGTILCAYEAELYRKLVVLRFGLEWLTDN